MTDSYISYVDTPNKRNILMKHGGEIYDEQIKIHIVVSFINGN